MLFSIVIPAYNAERHIERSIASVLKQDFDDYEILVINDGSTDSTKLLVEKLMKTHAHIRKIDHEKNKSLLQARKTGALSANSDYLLFLDADDELSCDALQVLAGEIAENPVDILHFGTDLNRECNQSPAVQAHMKSYITPVNELWNSSEIMRKVFIEGQSSWSMWGKLFSNAVIKEAYAHIDDVAINLAEDLLGFFFVCKSAQIYRGFPQKALYIYHYGTGNYGGTDYLLSQEEFEVRMSALQSVQKRIDKALSGSPANENSKEISRQIQKRLLRELFSQLFAFVDKSYWLTFYLKIIQNWPLDAVVNDLTARCWYSPDFLDGWMFSQDRYNEWVSGSILYYSPSSFELSEFLCAQSNRGEPSATIQAITDNQLQPEKLDPEVRIQSLQPRFAANTKAGFCMRTKTIIEAIRESACTSVVFLSWNSPQVFFDLLLLYSLGIKARDLQGRDLIELVGCPEGRAVLMNEANADNTDLFFADEAREDLGFEYGLTSYWEEVQRQKRTLAELSGIMNSRSQKLGYAITAPLRFFYRKLKKQ
jgi:glycosyltransferase involved in cell wall biosynthesis